MAWRPFVCLAHDYDIRAERCVVCGLDRADEDDLSPKPADPLSAWAEACEEAAMNPTRSNA